MQSRFELINVKGSFLIVVSDNPITPDCCVYDTYGKRSIIWRVKQSDIDHPKNLDYCKRVEAHLPLMNSGVIHGIELLPPLMRFTEQDMINCWKTASIDNRQVHGDAIVNHYCDFINSLSAKPYPTHFNASVSVCTRWMEEECETGCCGTPEKISKIISPNGQNFIWQGAYEYAVK